MHAAVSSVSCADFIPKSLKQIIMPPSVKFLHLRMEILANLFTVWLKLDDVARVDSASCNKSDRSIWLALLASSRCKFSLTSHECIDEVLLKWQILRNLCFRKVVLVGKMLSESSANPTDGTPTGDSTLQNCLKRICSHITALELSGGALSDLLWEMLLSDCPNLTNLRIMATTVKFNTPADHRTLPKLTRLFIDMHFFTAPELIAFVQHFPALTHLHISGNFFVGYLELTELCPHLTHLCLRDSCIIGPNFTKLMEQLKQGLKCLALPDCHRFRPEVLTQLSQHTLTLRCVHMTEKFDALGGAPIVANALNECKLLHTLYIHASVVASGELRMISVTTLHMEYCTQLALDKIDRSFPSVTTLGVLSTPTADDKFLTSIMHCVELNKKIRTVYVHTERAARALLQHQGVLVRKNVYFDVFSYDADC